MSRDSRKTKQYFDKYINDQYNRLEEFENLLQTITVDKHPQIYLYLYNLKFDLYNARYSTGSLKSELKSDVIDLLEYAKNKNEITYMESIDILSLCILYNIKDFDFNLLTERDTLIESLIAYITEGEYSKISEIKYPDSMQEFATIINKKDQELLLTYIKNKWYQSNDEMSWYNSHLNTEEVYTGYWSYLAAAIIKSFNMNKANFSTCEFIPIDLI